MTWKIWSTAGEIVDWLWKHSPTHENGGIDELTLYSDQVEVAELDTADYDDLQDFINNTVSAGRVIGGTISADGEDGNISVLEGSGFIKITAGDPNSETKSFDWDTTVIVAGAGDGQIKDGVVNYIYIDYSAGNPVPKATDDRTTIDMNTMFTLGRCYRFGATTPHIINSGTNLYDHIRVNHERLITVRGFERASGGDITEKKKGEPVEIGRYLAASAGEFYLGANPITTTEQDTSGTDRFTFWYHINSTTWEALADQEQVSNQQYDTGSELALLTGMHYGVFWIYIHMDGDIHVVCGRGDYSLAQAEIATVPIIPDAVGCFAILAAKVITQHNQDDIVAISSAYMTLFPVSAVSVHDELTGVAASVAHTSYILHSLATTEDDFLVASASGVFAKQTLAETLTTLGKAVASGLASLNATSKVVQQPASISDHLDDTAGGTDALTTKAATSNIVYDHGANTTTAHGAVSAATASKIVVRDASARAKFAQSAAAGDAIVADANNRAPNATLLEGSSKATVQDHTPKAHSIASHDDTTATGAELETLTDGSETDLHSHAADGGATVATGSYAGNNTDNRQIAVGFKCSLVLVVCVGTRSACRIIMPNSTTSIADGGNETDANLHGTNGFEVDQMEMNDSTFGTYYYWAISE